MDKLYIDIDPTTEAPYRLTVSVGPYLARLQAWVAPSGMVGIMAYIEDAAPWGAMLRLRADLPWQVQRCVRRQWEAGQWLGHDSPRSAA